MQSERQNIINNIKYRTITMKRIFITHIAPKDKILEYKVSSAACNFCYNLISGVSFDDVYSILPSYVNGKKEFPNKDGVTYIYSSWRWAGSLFRKFAPIIENLTIFRRIKRNSSVWLYNMTMLNIWLVLLLRWLKPSVKINIIVLDFTPGAKNNNFFLKQINKCHGRILLANSPLFNKDNSVILPGVTPNSNINYPTITEIKKEFLISGVLSENISMLTMLLESFSKMPHLTLHITGTIDNDTIIKEYSSKYENIKYHGCVPYNEYLNILHDTPFLLSTRNPEFPENQCNFPSKIIEALLHNRIIISTLHYEQLNGIDYFEVPSNKIGFIKEIESIVSSPSSKLLKYANQSVLVKEMFNTGVWNKKMKEIESYEKGI